MAFNNPTGNPTTGGGIIGVGSGAPANSIYIASNGYVGIGTTTPTHKLHLAGEDFRIDTNQAIRWDSPSNFTDAVLTVRTVSPFITMDYGSGNEFRFIAGAATNMVIKGGGNVGIGTTTPATLFTVATSTNIFNVLTSGNVGIGTASPSGRLTVNDGSADRFRVNSDNIIATIGTSGGAFAVNNLNNAASLLMVLNNGNVGIGGAGTLLIMKNGSGVCFSLQAPGSAGAATWVAATCPY